MYRPFHFSHTHKYCLLPVAWSQERDVLYNNTEKNPLRLHLILESTQPDPIHQSQGSTLLKKSIKIWIFWNRV